MPRTIVGAHGLRRFQSPAIAGGLGARQTLQQFAEAPKIHVADVKPGINRPLTASVDPPVESAAAAQPAPEKVVPEVPVKKPRKKKPEPEPEPEEDSGVDEETEEEEEIEELPKPTRKRPTKVDTELADKFKKESVPVPEPLKEEPAKKPRKKKVKAEGGEEKPKRAPSAWHLFMKEAKEWPDVKERKGNERIKYMGELYRQRKAEAGKKEEVVEKKEESAEV